MAESSRISELYKLLDGSAMVGGELTEADLENEDLVMLSIEVTNFFTGKEGVKVLDKNILGQIREARNVKVEVIVEGPTSYKPIAKEVDFNCKVRSVEIERTGGTVSDFTAHFNDRFKRLRDILTYSRNIGMVLTNDKLAQYSNGKEVTVVGMIYDKIITKKGNLMINIEDETGMTKIIFTKPEKGSSKELGALFDSAMKLVTDEVIAVKGKLWSPFIIANTVVWPDVPIHYRKQTKDDISIAFTSDTHIGSKLFMEGHFLKFLDWINGKVDYKRDMAGKIKYIMFGGDLVDGIGVYPDQDKELTILDIYDQYEKFFEYVSQIPDYIKVFVIPGNHDAVQLSDPQPKLNDELTRKFRKSNVELLSSPSYVDMEGLKLFAYHGTSLDSVIHNVAGCSYMKPETAMIEILKRRHASPIYGEKSIMPSRRDHLVISETPDIMHMGHVHKNGSAEYHGTQLINSGTWQSKTNYQLKLGHVPTPAVLPVYSMSRGTMGEMDFNDLITA